MGPGDIDGGTVVVLGVWEGRMASATVSAAQCKEERRLGINVVLRV